MKVQCSKVLRQDSSAILRGTRYTSAKILDKKAADTATAIATHDEIFEDMLAEDAKMSKMATN